VLGGTFNPPHAGHLALARHARSELRLHLVLLVPAHTPPHKPPAADAATPSQRLAMCELAAAGVEGVSACALEVRRGGASYTVDTLQELHDANPDASLTLIIGADIALTLPSWRQPRRLLDLAQLAVAQRGGAAEARVLEALAPLHPEPARVKFLSMAPIEISSSQVREQIAAGLPLHGELPAAVERYVAEHDLYGASAT
jgi:nicotinate-nucleotide adenylyltransferase